MCKRYLANRSENNYTKHKMQRSKVKKLVAQAKAQIWKEFENK